MRAFRPFALAAVAALLIALLAFDLVGGQRLHDQNHRHECAICILVTADTAATAAITGAPLHVPVLRLDATLEATAHVRRELLTYEARGPPARACS